MTNIFTRQIICQVNTGETKVVIIFLFVFASLFFLGPLCVPSNFVDTRGPCPEGEGQANTNSHSIRGREDAPDAVFPPLCVFGSLRFGSRRQQHADSQVTRCIYFIDY